MMRQHGMSLFGIILLSAITFPGGSSADRTAGAVLDLLDETGGSALNTQGVALNAAPLGSWEPASSMTAPRSKHSATLLLNGELLVTGGVDDVGNHLPSADRFDPASGSWRETALLALARADHTATMLLNGEVIVVGGRNREGVLPQVEIYNTRTEVWRSAEPLLAARASHTATLLSSGQVLVIGGIDTSVPLQTVELFDPQAGTWRVATDLPTARFGHTANLLPSGEVIVLGGTTIGGIASRRVEIYDPATGTWRRVADLLSARSGHTATLLPSGKILVTGGENEEGVLADSELYGPTENTWRRTKLLPILPRRDHTATLLPSNEVLVVGGQSGIGEGDSPQAEVFNPTTEAWLRSGVIEQIRAEHTATLLPSGAVLVVGTSINAELFVPIDSTWQQMPDADPVLKRQKDHATTLLSSGQAIVTGGLSISQRSWIYDSISGEWKAAADLITGRRHHRSTLLPTGSVLLTGGFGEDFLRSTELYNPATGRWNQANSLSSARAGHTASLLSTGQVLVVGGEDARASTKSAEIYDPETGEWKLTGELNISRSAHTATLLQSGEVLVVGGATVSDPVDGPRDVRALESAELYDPTTGTWELTSPLATGRILHTATLLRSGKVLVVGGQTDESGGSRNLASAEVYDPVNRTWTEVEDLAYGRSRHTATLLPSGGVLIVGGPNEALATAEIFEPTTEKWIPAEPPQSGHERHTATLLPSGRVLLLGGDGVELFRPESTADDRRPAIIVAPTTIRYGEPLTITGSGFRGGFDASDGTSNSSPVNYPLIQLQALVDDRVAWLIPERLPAPGEEVTSVTVFDLPPIFDPGPHLLSVVTAGVASEPRAVDVECSLEITQPPTDQTVAIGSVATFTVESQGGRLFQWQKDGIDIPGATAPYYITPPISAPDSGTAFRVRVDSGCTNKTSQAAILTVADDEPPEVRVVSPEGGEFWTLSDTSQGANTQTISWEMSDNVRICDVAVRLRFSNDGGASWKSTELGRFDRAGSCPHPGEGTTNLLYSIPVEPPSGVAGSLYQIQIKAKDHIGRTTVARSGTFFIVRPNNDSVKTMIVTNISRMRDNQVMGITNQQARQLRQNLGKLARHPRVQGLVIDLSADSSLANLYHEWDEDPSSYMKANNVLLGEGGLHERLRDLFEIFPSVESLVIVGDDRIIPFARIRDRTVNFLESNYTSPKEENDPEFEFSPSGLIAEASTVGISLAADQYLSDDPIGVLDPLQRDELQEEGRIFLADLAIGRLVETPEEISTAIAAFIGQDGVLDIGALDPQTGRKVLVTGYDFLIDSGKRIVERWQKALGQDPELQALTPVDGELVSFDWGIQTGATSIDGRRQALETHLSGFGEGPYSILSLNGHATHFEEGIPGDRGSFDIQGLEASRIGALCQTDPRLCLTGSVVYAVGCHGGLPVAGSSDSRDRDIDLPQTMLGARVLAYIANTGYGWGLLNGIGYSERLVEIMTEELTRGGTVVVGEAVKRSKQRYFLELARVDAYDTKTLMQWALFGFPMYAVQTGIATGKVEELDLVSGVPPLAEDLPAQEFLEGVMITREISAGASAAGPLKVSLPDFLTVVEQRFEFQSDKVYTKHLSSGERVFKEIEGCPDPDGCYYSLNGLSTGTEDLPIQPFFVFDSRLAGTSQHGVLWKGSIYDTESQWIPLTAELASNGGSAERMSTPRQIYIRPRGPRRRRRSLDGDAELCRHSDLDINSVVFTTGEVLDTDFGIVQRLHRNVDLEVFYYNNIDDPVQNCDETAPTFLGESFHHIVGTRVVWEVPEIATGVEGDGVQDDEGEVWRLIVVYDVGGSGQWVPLELEKNRDLWHGSLQLAQTATEPEDGIFRLTYYLQAVDRRGNVGWLEFPEADCLREGCQRSVPGIPLPVEVVVESGASDLTVGLNDEQDPVEPGRVIVYTVEVRNLGPATANALSARVTLDERVDYIIAGGGDWTCIESVSNELECTRFLLDRNSTGKFSLLVRAPSDPGTMISTVTVSAVERDPETSNNSDAETTRVALSQAIESF